MKKFRLTSKYAAVLAEYGLQKTALEDCTGVHYEAGEMIVEAGEPLSDLRFVVKGMAKIYRASLDGKSLILCYYMSDGIIGEIELLTGQKNVTATVRAVSDFDCIQVPYERCKKELERNNVFTRQLAVMVAKKLNESDENYVRTALCSAEERLCWYIYKNESDGLFRDVLSDTAGSIGTSYRHVFRLLNGLCEEGILQDTEKGYVIVDRKRLKEKAGV